MLMAPSLVAMSTMDGMYQWFDPFDTRLYWIVVSLNLVLQAVILRKLLEMSWLRVLITTVLINVGVLLLWNILCFGLPRPGWRGDNPTLFTLVTLAIVGFWNLLINTPIWWRSTKVKAPLEMVASLMAISQVIWIAVSFCLLMIPERPFPGLEKSTGRRRYMMLMNATKSKDFVVPKFSNAEEFLAALDLPPEIAYAPIYPRFAMDETKGEKLKVNTKLSGYKLGSAKGIEWFFEAPYGPAFFRKPQYLDLKTGAVTRWRD